MYQHWQDNRGRGSVKKKKGTEVRTGVNMLWLAINLVAYWSDWDFLGKVITFTATLNVKMPSQKDIGCLAQPQNLRVTEV